jgi:hypothetical protein
MVLSDECDVQRRPEEWAKYVAENSLYYIDKGESNLVEKAKKYIEAVSTCRGLLVESREAFNAMEEFCKEFEAYRIRRS